MSGPPPGHQGHREQPPPGPREPQGYGGWDAEAYPEAYPEQGGAAAYPDGHANGYGYAPEPAGYGYEAQPHYGQQPYAQDYAPQQYDQGQLPGADVPAQYAGPAAEPFPPTGHPPGHDGYAGYERYDGYGVVARPQVAGVGVDGGFDARTTGDAATSFDGGYAGGFEPSADAAFGAAYEAPVTTGFEHDHRDAYRNDYTEDGSAAFGDHDANGFADDAYGPVVDEEIWSETEFTPEAGTAHGLVPAPRREPEAEREDRYDRYDDDAAEPDAEPARAARRVPIWHPPGLVPALLTCGLAGVLAVSALAGGAAAVAGVVFLQVLTAAGWFRLHGMWPARQGIALAVLAGLAADAAVLLADDDALRVLPGVLAGVLGLTLVQQLVRRDGRPELLPALTVTTSAAALTVFDVLFVLAARVDSPGVRDGALVAVAAVAAAAAVLCAALPLPGPVGTVLGLAAAAGVGAVGGSVADLGSAAVVLGAGAGLTGVLGRRVSGYDHPSRFVHMTAGVALPLALTAPAVYLLGRVAIG